MLGLPLCGMKLTHIPTGESASVCYRVYKPIDFKLRTKLFSLLKARVHARSLPKGEHIFTYLLPADIPYPNELEPFRRQVK